MAEKTILVCDTCGKPAAETVTIRVSRGNFVKDLCAAHVTQLVNSARKPRPGRPKGSTSRTPKVAKTSRTPKAAAAAPKRRGRPRKKPA